jgi:hypothetical protein
MAYRSDGTPKRTVGIWYPDIGTYTIEMEEEDNATTRRYVDKNKVHVANRKNSKKS